MVRSARPRNSHPLNGVLRPLEANCSLSTTHSRSGSKMVTSPAAPAASVPRSKASNRAGLTVNMDTKRGRSTTLCRWSRISQKIPTAVSRPTIPKGAAANSTSFS
jgi:hypothetical protein